MITDYSSLLVLIKYRISERRPDGRELFHDHQEYAIIRVLWFSLRSSDKRIFPWSERRSNGREVFHGLHKFEIIDVHWFTSILLINFHQNDDQVATRLRNLDRVPGLELFAIGVLYKVGGDYSRAKLFSCPFLSVSPPHKLRMLGVCLFGIRFNEWEIEVSALWCIAEIAVLLIEETTSFKKKSISFRVLVRRRRPISSRMSTDQNDTISSSSRLFLFLFIRSANYSLEDWVFVFYARRLNL